MLQETTGPGIDKSSDFTAKETEVNKVAATLYEKGVDWSYILDAQQSYMQGYSFKLNSLAREAGILGDDEEFVPYKHDIPFSLYNPDSNSSTLPDPSTLPVLNFEAMSSPSTAYNDYFNRGFTYEEEPREEGGLEASTSTAHISNTEEVSSTSPESHEDEGSQDSPVLQACRRLHPGDSGFWEDNGVEIAYKGKGKGIAIPIIEFNTASDSSESDSDSNSNSDSSTVVPSGEPISSDIESGTMSLIFIKLSIKNGQGFWQLWCDNKFYIALKTMDKNWPKWDLWLNTVFTKFLIAHVFYITLNVFNMTSIIPIPKIEFFLLINSLIVFLFSLIIIFYCIKNLCRLNWTKKFKISNNNGYPGLINKLLVIMQKANYPSDNRAGPTDINKLKKTLVRYLIIFILNLIFIIISYNYFFNDFFNLNLF